MREDWTECCFEDLLDYEQPTKYIVKSTKYNDSYKMPVLTAGKSFIKGYTNETDGIFDNLPTIIFDDFTTATQYVNFKFKVKSSAMKILVPTSKLVNMSLTYYAMQVNRVRSDTHKRYWISVFAKKKFLLPPLVEQKAIVKKIEELFSSLDSGIADLKKAQGQLRIYRQAVLKKAFEGALTREWREKQTNLSSADELLKEVKKERQNHYEQQLTEWKDAVQLWDDNGKEGKKPLKSSKPAKVIVIKENSENLLVNVESTSYNIVDCLHSTPKFQSNGKYCVDTTCIENGNIIWDRIRYVSEDSYKNRIRRLKPQKGDILFAREGTVGTTLVLKKNIDICLGQRMMMFRALKIINPIFFMYYFQSNTFIKQYKPLIGGTTSPHLNIRDIKKFSFPILLLQEQHQIVQEIESRLSVCDKVEESLTVSLEKAQALRQSILKKAFVGTLLSEEEIATCKADAAYEPASVLLAKIKAEKKKK